MVQNRLIAISGFCAITAILFHAALSPQVVLPMDHGLDKVWHFAAFAVLMSAAMFFIRSNAQAFIGMLILFAIGVGIELAQAFIPGRESSIGDILADTAGILAGYIAALHLRPHLENLLTKKVKWA